MTNNCRTCFYASTNIDSKPCKSCDESFSNYAPMNSFIDDEPEDDVVNKPSHYQLINGLEVRDIIAVLVDKMYEQGTPAVPLFTSDYVQMMQYLMRFMDKNGVEDLKKAQYYLTELIEAYE